MIEVIQPGSAVLIGEKVRAVVLQVVVRDKNLIEYQVSWWEGNSRRSEWLQEIEVERSDSTQSLQIGFR